MRSCLSALTEVQSVKCDNSGVRGTGSSSCPRWWRTWTWTWRSGESWFLYRSWALISILQLSLVRRTGGCQWSLIGFCSTFRINLSNSLVDIHFPWIHSPDTNVWNPWRLDVLSLLRLVWRWWILFTGRYCSMNGNNVRIVTKV